jgi:RNA polymerase sigma factor (TIGR02999 family)
MESPEARTITRLLADWRQGSSDALGQLMPLVYEDLRRMAARQLRGERAGHTLQPTEVVHEAYRRLAGNDVEWSDRVHFYAVAARTMRRLLVDHARKRKAQRRGGDLVRIDLDAEPAAPSPERSPDVEQLDEALCRLELLDPRKARAVEMHYFAGMRLEEIGAALDVSVATVGRDLAFARAWLGRELTGGRDER